MCRAPTWASWTKRAAKGALCQVVFGRYMPISRPVWVGIAQWAATSIEAATAIATATGASAGAGRAASLAPSPRLAQRPAPTPAAIVPASTQPGR